MNPKSLSLFLAAVVTVLVALPGARADAPAGNPTAGKAVFMANCIVCHGNEGKGNGPGAAGLNPKPRNFTDPAVMAKIDGPTRLKAVTSGGASVGLSPTMPPFKEVLSEVQIRDVLAFVKTLAK